jgi:hypothetical protein
VRKAVAKENKMDVYAIIKKPVVSESSMKKIEVFTVVLANNFCSLRTFFPSLLISVLTRDRSATL